MKIKDVFILEEAVDDLDDYADFNIPMLAKMYERRRRGYKIIGYEIEE